MLENANKTPTLAPEEPPYRVGMDPGRIELYSSRAAPSLTKIQGSKYSDIYMDPNRVWV